jgi:hypothetical protein
MADGSILSHRLVPGPRPRSQVLLRNGQPLLAIAAFQWEQIHPSI